ncbi:zinc protease [Planktotalea frisia]|jgi:zinc protease|uniref:Insulinase n=1 Tax=Planktotalea frisia TaxID=696762 RepID=A0A1L9P034_9RHOB|nr:pitrilysin family protein [Planktotalea frisia]OJI94877.1 insulinase [Planktotalea frisia]PZX31362.1 zinc protease [Planktotalea frisia]
MRFGLRMAGPVLALLAAPISAFAEITRFDEQVSTFDLDNGMEVVVIEDHRAPVVVHMMWYRAGSADEQPGVSGVAHFLEHLLFKATDNMEAGEFSKTVAANGGSDNAFTSYDYTAYFQRVASDRLELMMQMEADRMVNLRLTEADILTEREVIIEERNQRTENDPNALFGEQASAALYMNHRYGVPVIGWRHEMETLELPDTLEYYEQFYAPNNAILIVAGDVTPQEVKEMAERHYGPLKANPDLEPRARPQEPVHNVERRLVFEDPRVSQPYVRRSYLAPERDSEDQKTAAALMLGANLLGDGQTSFMTQKLQFEDKTAVFATAYYRGTSLDDTSFTTIVVPVPGVSLSEAEAQMDAVLEEFMETPIDQAHLARIKSQMRASRIYAKDNVQGLANSYGRALTSGLTIADILAWPDVVENITEEDIKTAMRTVLNNKSSVTGWLTSGREAAQ